MCNQSGAPQGIQRYQDTSPCCFRTRRPLQTISEHPSTQPSSLRSLCMQSLRSLPSRSGGRGCSPSSHRMLPSHRPHAALTPPSHRPHTALTPPSHRPRAPKRSRRAHHTQLTEDVLAPFATSRTDPTQLAPSPMQHLTPPRTVAAGGVQPPHVQRHRHHRMRPRKRPRNLVMISHATLGSAGSSGAT